MDTDNIANADRGDNWTPTPEPTATPAAAATPTPEVKTEAAVVDTSVDTGKTEETKTEDTSARDDKGRFIPKGRFDEAVQKERDKREAVERELVELRKQQAAVAKNVQVSDLEAQLVELRKADRRAIMDGDENKSVELGAQIDRINRQIMIAESQTMSTQAQENARESIRVDMAIEKLESLYPVLQEGSETYDQDLVDLVLAQQTQYIQRDRMSPSAALEKAATLIMARTQPAAKVDDGKPAGGLKDAAGSKVSDREALQKQKNIDAAMKTPPNTKDVGMDTDKAGMKDGMPVPTNIDDLKAIPESTLKRMRGDMIS